MAAPRFSCSPICCLVAGFSSRPKQISPRNSRTVLSSVTLKLLRINRVSARIRSSAVLIPIVSSRADMRLPTPQTSAAGRMAISLCSLRSSVRATTPRWLAGLGGVITQFCQRFGKTDALHRSASYDVALHAAADARMPPVHCRFHPTTVHKEFVN